ncbi:MAG: hypothetical protein IJL87_00820 [Clostridia bacterium]|nr:hypothetical protein [Clostridia bacterium]
MDKFTAYLIYGIIFFGPPVFSSVISLISHIRYVKARRNPQKFSAAECEAKKKTWIISLIFFGAYALAAMAIIMIMFIFALPVV